MAESVAACLHDESPFYAGDSHNATGTLAGKVHSLGVEIVRV